jgi:hypothetical protein
VKCVTTANARWPQHNRAGVALGNSHKIVNASTLLLAGGLFGMQSAGFQNEMKRQ